MNYDYTYDLDNSPADAGVNAAILSGLLSFLLLLALVSYVITSFLLGRLFLKAGVPQWAAWVPVYNNWKLLQIGGQKGFWALLMFIPFVNLISFVFVYISMHHIGRKLGKENWFVLVAIFLPIVWLIWLGFDDSKWPHEEKTVNAKKRTTTKKSVSSRKKAA